MVMQMLEVTDVKTKADVHRIVAQKCIFNGYNIAIGTFVLGVATLPYAFTRIKGFTRIQKEYRVLLGVFISLGASFSSGIYFKNSCQRKIINQLEDLNLGHLTEGIFNEEQL